MFTAKVSFALPHDGPDAVIETAHDLLSAWHHNGQIVGSRWKLAQRDDVLDAYVGIAERESLDAIHDNRYARAERAALGDAFLGVVVLGTVPEGSACTCASRTAMLLHADYIDDETPVRCLDCFGRVPLYRLPYLHDEEHLILLQWAADYRACDLLQMHCTTGERFAEAQLARHDSSLSRNGRDLCRRLEAATGTPVYYPLHKQRSRGIAAELRRSCPECGGPWKLAQPIHHFDFQCADCRLLSAIAADAS